MKRTKRIRIAATGDCRDRVDVAVHHHDGRDHSTLSAVAPEDGRRALGAHERRVDEPSSVGLFAPVGVLGLVARIHGAQL